jgi:hypothetical protein
VSRGGFHVGFMLATPMSVIPIFPMLRFSSLPRHQEDEEERVGRKKQRSRRGLQYRAESQKRRIQEMKMNWITQRREK